MQAVRRILASPDVAGSHLHRQARAASVGGKPSRRVPQTTRERLLFGYGLHGSFQTLNMGADWEFEDGTPAPKTAVQNYTERQLKTYVTSIIDACATVEEMAESNQLPLRPGTDEIRKFDPMCPLYLPINDVIMDDTTTAHEKYELYADRAPYYNPQLTDPDTVVAHAGEAPSIHDTGDGSPVASSEAEDIKSAKSKRGRRKRVVTVKQHWRTTQPLGRSGPFNLRDKGLFDLGHGTAN